MGCANSWDDAMRRGGRVGRGGVTGRRRRTPSWFMTKPLRGVDDIRTPGRPWLGSEPAPRPWTTTDSVKNRQNTDHGGDADGSAPVLAVGPDVPAAQLRVRGGWDGGICIQPSYTVRSKQPGIVCISNCIAAASGVSWPIQRARARVSAFGSRAELEPNGESTAGLLPFGDVNSAEQDFDVKQDPASNLLPSQGEFGDKSRSSFHSALLLLHFRLALAGTRVASIEVAICLPFEVTDSKTTQRILRFHHLPSPQPP